MSLESQVVALLSASILRPFFLIAAAWVTLRVFRVRHPASRHAVWTAALVGMLLLPVVTVLMPHWNIDVLPAKYEAPVVTHPTDPLPLPDGGGPEPIAPRVSVPNSDRKESAFQKEAALQHPLLWLYFTGLLAMLAHRAAGWILLRRVVSRSVSLHLPFLRESPDIAAPVAVGVLRPLVLLPPSWRDWNNATRSAVLAHEFAHLRRRDTLTAALARLAKTVLWFHPLAWWISRQISELAESACDAEALQSIGDPAAYSRVLLYFAQGVNHAGYRVALPGLAIANSSELGRRIDQVFRLSGDSMRRLKRPGVVMALLGVPALGFAATAGMATAGAALSLSRGKLIAFLRMPSAPLLTQIQTAPKMPAAAAGAATPVRDRNATGPHFETASLKIAAPPVSGELCWGGCGGPLSPYPESRDEITYRHFTLRKILLRAYNVKENRISGPASLDIDAYDVNAKAAPGTTQEQFQLMLRNLLAERFNLTAHLDSAQGYELVVAPGGPKLRPPQDSGSVDAATPSLIRVTTPTGFVILSTGQKNRSSSSISLLADTLSAALGVPVTDRTGLAGNFDIPYQDLLPVFQRSRAGEQKNPDQTVDVSAIRNGLAELGLALNETETAAERLVVDHVDSLTAAKP